MAGSLGVWVATGTTSGAITSGGTTALNGGSLSETLTSFAIGAGVGTVVGAAGQRIAIGSAAAAARRGANLISSINRGDNFGRIGGEGLGLGASGFVNGLRSGGKQW